MQLARKVKQSIIVDSTIEFKYIALSKMTKEIVRLKKFMSELRVVFSIVELIEVRYNNNRVIA